jgi:hypothetical protein
VVLQARVVSIGGHLSEDTRRATRIVGLQLFPRPRGRLDDHTHLEAFQHRPEAPQHHTHTPLLLPWPFSNYYPMETAWFSQFPLT